MKRLTKKDPFKDLSLDKEERELEAALKRGEYEESKDLDETRKMLTEAAKRHVELTTSKPVTIRINQMDLIKLKAKARKKNVPYQTLLGVLIRDYNEGKRDLRL